MVYRFRLSFEDHEDVYREIDIQGKQNYEDLHRAIQESIGFDNSKEASFFMSDDLWRKGLELALHPPKEEDDDDDGPRRGKKDIRKMSECRIANFIDDPHQRLVYVFDPVARWTLLIELSRILQEEPKMNYPRTSKSVGIAPKQYKQAIIPPPVEGEEEEDDEEDKKRKEKVFTAVEQFDVSEHPGAEEGEEEIAGADDIETPGEEADEEPEEEGSDFDPGAFGTEEEL
jgi:hypothetical protein